MQKRKLVSRVQTNQSKFPIKKHTIVVADDDPAILEAMKLMLEFYDFEVKTIADGMVVSKLLSFKPTLLLLDICMPGVDGREICKELKATASTKDIPVIMISANYDIADASRDSGADDYLAKPFEVQDLLKKINKYLLN